MFWACETKEASIEVNNNFKSLLKTYESSKSPSDQLIALNKLVANVRDESDSIQNKYLSSFAYDYLKLKDTSNFKTLNRVAFNTAQRQNNWFKLGDVEWNYASYHNNLQKYDSAFYHFKEAKTYFSKADNDFYEAKMLYGMAFIKSRFRDYTGSENLIFEALSLVEEKEQNNSFYYSCYTLLSVIYRDKEAYKEALDYQEQSLSYLDNSESSIQKQLGTLNNSGIIYHEIGEFEKAIKNYKEALNNNALKPNSSLRAKLLDNLAYSQLKLGDTTGVLDKLKESLEIREELNNKSGLAIIKIHLAQYYDYANNRTTALKLAQESKTLAKELENSRDYLNALELLAVLDPSNAKNYLQQYIRYNDSITNLERDNQNKFMRIAYETDQYKAKTKQLSEQNIWLLFISLGIVIILTLIYFIRNQYILKEKLALENDIQTASEEVYMLTIKRQIELEKERLSERNRIAEDLHDGVLGQLFATRLNLSYLPIKEDDKNIILHERYLGELQQIEKEIRDVSHTLSNNFSDSDIGFSKSLELLTREKAKLANLNAQIYIDGNQIINKLPQEYKVNIYRILQESLQNIIKHAEATLISVRLNADLNHIELTIEDDGKGISDNHKKGIGLKNIASRTQKIKGELKIIKRKPKGTSLEINIKLS